MADEVDLAQAIEDELRLRGVLAARAAMPAGAPGECEGCFEESPRLVGGRCARCRDGRTRIAPIVRGVERPQPPSGDRADRDETLAAIPAAARREDAMGDMRLIQIRAKDAVLAAIERVADEECDGLLGPAAVLLIERGMGWQPEPAGRGELTPQQRVRAQLAAVEMTVTELIGAAEAGGDTDALEEQLGEAIAAREEAEAKLAQLRAVLS